MILRAMPKPDPVVYVNPYLGLPNNNKPLDIFEDFKVSYNHKFDDSESMSGRVTPYTDRFKLPLTANNRELLQIPFDVTYPLGHDIQGDLSDMDGNVVLYLVYNVTSVVTNVLEPYIELDALDRFSWIITQMRKTPFSDTIDTNVIFHLTDGWIYNSNNGLANPTTAPFTLPFYNWNNKDVTFATDPMRGLNQLQPTWVIPQLLTMLFAHFGASYSSTFFNGWEGVYPSVQGTDLGLMLPVVFQNENPSTIVGNCKFDFSSPFSWGGKDIFIGVETSLPTSPRSVFFNSIIPEYINDQMDNADGAKFNEVHYKKEFQSTFATTSEVCSLVNGKGKVTFKKNALETEKIKAYIGAVNTDNPSTVDITSINSMSPEPLDVWLVPADYEKDYSGEYVDVERSSSSYDFAQGVKIGTAAYTGLVDVNVNPTAPYPNFTQMEFEVTLFGDAEMEVDFVANKTLSYGLVLAADRDVDWQVDYNVRQIGGSATGAVKFKIKDNNIDIFDWSNSTNIDYLHHQWSQPPTQAFSLQFEYTEPTSIPSLREYDTPAYDRPACAISLRKSYLANEDKLTVLDIIIMIMDRFNLSMFTRSTGNIHIDTYENRKEGTESIDALIDEAVTTNYSRFEYGILNVKDNSPNFYKEGYNALSEFSVNVEGRESMDIGFDSAIVNEKMFKDEYNHDSYEVLKWKNDSNYWGTSDRVQASVEDLKPTFCMFGTPRANELRFPVNTTTDAVVNKDSAFGAGIGFYNYMLPTQDGRELSCVASTIKGCYDLLSFEDNKIIDKTTVYKTRWEAKIKSKMDNEVVKIELGVYLSPEDFAKFIHFPNINYFGTTWDMEEFTGYPVTALNGGVVEMSLVEQIVIPITGLCLTPFNTHLFTDATSAEACASLQTRLRVMKHNGSGVEPVIGNRVYSSSDEPWTGSTEWRYMPDFNKALFLDSTGLVTDIYYCAAIPPPTMRSMEVDIVNTSTDLNDICQDSPAWTTLYRDGDVLPTIGDTFYTDAAGTIPYDGQGHWHLNDFFDGIRILPNGGFIDVGYCD